MLLIIIIFVINKRIKKYSQIKNVNIKLKHLKELRINKEISEETYHREKEKLLQKISDLFKNNSKSLMFFGMGILILITVSVMKNSLTGHLTKDYLPNNFNIIGYLIFIGFMSILIYSIYNKKIKIIINIIHEKLRKKYPSNSVNGLINKKVYTTSGDYIGKVKEIILKNNNISDIRIDLENKFKLNKISISWNSVVSCGEVIMINQDILEKIRKSNETF